MGFGCGDRLLHLQVDLLRGDGMGGGVVGELVAKAVGVEQRAIPYYGTEVALSSLIVGWLYESGCPTGTVNAAATVVVIAGNGKSDS